jgi:hypothetical protein
MTVSRPEEAMPYDHHARKPAARTTSTDRPGTGRLIDHHRIRPDTNLRALYSSVPGLADDLAVMAVEILQLYSALIEECLISANLRAAIWAALGAQSDGEPDPLAYLRDEIPDAGNSRSEWGGRNDTTRSIPEGHAPSRPILAQP